MASGCACSPRTSQRFDREGIPTYLESSNAVNNPRYERIGYGRVGEFMTPGGSAMVTAYWRDAP